MSYADLGLDAITTGATVYVVDDRPPPPPRAPADPLTTALFFGGFVVLAGVIIHYSEKQRQERQKYMTPCERSMDDCMEAMRSRSYYQPYYREPGLRIEL
jgi:hypothetical protein